MNISRTAEGIASRIIAATLVAYSVALIAQSAGVLHIA